MVEGLAQVVGESLCIHLLRLNWCNSEYYDRKEL